MTIAIVVVGLVLYLIPTPTQAERTAVGNGVQRVLDNAPDKAGDVLAETACTVRERVDTASQRTFHEILDNAGTDRRTAGNRQADIAHTTAASVFENRHELLVAREVPVVRPHEFANGTAPDSDVVVSAGQKAEFAHVEVSKDLRQTPSARDQVASALPGRKSDR